MNLKIEVKEIKFDYNSDLIFRKASGVEWLSTEKAIWGFAGTGIGLVRGNSKHA